MVLLLTGKLQKPGKLSKAPTTLEPRLGNSGLARARLRARGSRPLTLDLFQQDLQETLAPVPQTPLIFPIGLAKEAALLPGLFSDPDRAEIQERLAAILDRLLGLAPQDRVKDWQLEARPSVRGPLRVGTEFALQVRPAKAGHLIVFTVAADDSVTFLFPNRYVPQSAVEANRERAIPYPRGLVIQPPVGKETYNLYWRDKGHDPSEAFPIGLCGDQMPVGRLDDLVRRLEGRGIRKDVAMPPRRGRAGHGDQTRWRDGDGQKTGRRDEARALDPRRGRRAKRPLNEGGLTGTPPYPSRERKLRS